MKKTILLDTDIGDDIDDAVALALSLRIPNIQLAAVTTVYKDTVKKAKLAKNFLEQWGIVDVPVGIGESCPYKNVVNVSEVPCQYPALSQNFTGNLLDDGVQLILDTVRANPQITIVSIGPLTNIARAVEREPTTMRDVQITLMGGMLKHAYCEGNITSDPEAAHIVFNSGMSITMLPLDITLMAEITSSLQNKMFAVEHPGMKMLERMAELWKRDCLVNILKSWGSYIDGDEIEASLGIHDPMTVACVARPELFTKRPKLILVERKGEYTRGVTVESINAFTSQPCGYNADVVVDVKLEEFMEWFVYTMTCDDNIAIGAIKG